MGFFGWREIFCTLFILLPYCISDLLWFYFFFSENLANNLSTWSMAIAMKNTCISPVIFRGTIHDFCSSLWDLSKNRTVSPRYWCLSASLTRNEALQSTVVSTGQEETWGAEGPDKLCLHLLIPPKFWLLIKYCGIYPSNIQVEIMILFPWSFMKIKCNSIFMETKKPVVLINKYVQY